MADIIDVPETVPTEHPYAPTQPVEFQYELAVLNEECGEVAQMVGKTLRFGWDSSSPFDPDKTNLELLHEEVGDVLAAAEFAAQRGMLDTKVLAARKKKKLDKLHRLAPGPMRAMAPLSIHSPQKKPVEHVALAIVLTFVLALAGGAFALGQASGRAEVSSQQ